MRAVVLHEHGDIDNLKYHEDYTDPECGENQVIIRVKATSLNYHDVFTTKGMPGIKVPLPIVIGLDISGEIAEIGKEVDGWSVGDRVLIRWIPSHQKRVLWRDVGWWYSRTVCCGCDPSDWYPDGYAYEQAAALPA